MVCQNPLCSEFKSATIYCRWCIFSPLLLFCSSLFWRWDNINSHRDIGNCKNHQITTCIYNKCKSYDKTKWSDRDYGRATNIYMPAVHGVGCSINPSQVASYHICKTNPVGFRWKDSIFHNKILNEASKIDITWDYYIFIQCLCLCITNPLPGVIPQDEQHGPLSTAWTGCLPAHFITGKLIAVGKKKLPPSFTAQKKREKQFYNIFIITIWHIVHPESIHSA